MEKQISIVEMSRSRELRVNLTEFKGYDLVGLRWWDEPDADSEGKSTPTKRGVSFDVRDLPKVIAALQETEREARAAGLFDAAEAA